MTLARPNPQTVVIFGASGDLTSRKVMPAFYNLFARDLLPIHFSIVGYARTEMNDQQFGSLMMDSVRSRSDLFQEDTWHRFSEHLEYVSGEFSTEGAMSHLVKHLDEAEARHGTQRQRLFYCATPPAAFPQIAQRIGEEGMSKRSRIVIEKPFGRDVATARELNETLHSVFQEDQIFRIDHYLGKETVQNILVFRFSNGMFEPIWNRRYVKCVEITVAESLGIERRGKFYDSAGAIRDVVQNHLFQLFALLAMEPPSSFDAESIRDEKVKVLRAVPPIEPLNVVRGQYGPGTIDGEKVRGYCDEENVHRDSKTESFVAIKAGIENWRWAGVPFFLRTGKRLARRATQVTVVFNDAPHMLFANEQLEVPESNHLSIRIQPNEGISLTFDAKVPGPEMKVVPVEMNFDYEESFGMAPAEAYERLLHEAMEGDRTLFTRADEVERAWEILAPLLQGGEVEPYPAGSWGPKLADDLIAPGAWHLT